MIIFPLTISLLSGSLILFSQSQPIPKPDSEDKQKIDSLDLYGFIQEDQSK